MPIDPDRSPLVAYGWDDGWERVAPPGARVGRVVRVDRGECDVVASEGRVRALSDALRAQDEVAPATGDWVELSAPGVGRDRIERVLPRRHTLVRRDPSEAVVDQVLVANVDHVLLVHGLDRPLPPGRLERFLVQAWDCGADAGVVLTKSDVAPSVGDTLAVIGAVAPGLPVSVTSAARGEGLEALRRAVAPGRTAALLGASGVGKSTLVNALVGAPVQAVGEVRPSDAKGRHTTTARELLLVPGAGAIVDTPGMRAVGLWAHQEAVDRVFADIVEAAASCRFDDCRHDQEPGCAVRGLVEDRRLQRYRDLVAEIEEIREREARRRRPRSGGRRRR